MNRREPRDGSPTLPSFAEVEVDVGVASAGRCGPGGPRGALICALLLGACAATPVAAGGELGALIARARAGGAARCAPRELALAEAHAAFAAEVSDDPARARDHLRAAEVRARQALDLSPAPRCRQLARP